MKLRIFLGLFAALFLFVAYFFISHAYVFMRLTSALAFMAVVLVLALGIAFLGRLR